MPMSSPISGIEIRHIWRGNGEHLLTRIGINSARGKCNGVMKACVSCAHIGGLGELMYESVKRETSRNRHRPSKEASKNKLERALLVTKRIRGFLAWRCRYW